MIIKAVIMFNTGLLEPSEMSHLVSDVSRKLESYIEFLNSPVELGLRSQ